MNIWLYRFLTSIIIRIIDFLFLFSFILWWRDCRQRRCILFTFSLIALKYYLTSFLTPLLRSFKFNFYLFFLLIYRQLWYLFSLIDSEYLELPFWSRIIIIDMPVFIESQFSLFLQTVDHVHLNRDSWLFRDSINCRCLFSNRSILVT